MKKVKKPVFFLVFAAILLFAASTVFGVKYQYGDTVTTIINGLSDIRLGIDIQGGVDVTFEPGDGAEASEAQIDAATEVIKLRLSTLNINDYEVYSDADSGRIIVRFPWQSGEKDFDPEAAVAELGDMAELTFRYGDQTSVDENGMPNGELVLSGGNVTEAQVGQSQDDNGDYQWVVMLSLDEEGTAAFAEATSALYSSGGTIGIWMDDTCISAPTVSAVISDGNAIITNSSFTYDSAKSLADKINSGALPFSLETTSFKTISPTMGQGALNAMILSGIIAFVLIAIYMIVNYRLPGAVAVIGLLGQVTGTLACVSGWFGFMDSSTLTIPGIAGIILAIGMGVDCNIITGERIKEELASGKSLDSALKVAYKRAFSSILDGNVTVVIVAIVLMGAFGTPDSAFAKLLKYVFYFFGATTEGVIYSFGFTLLTGVVLNFVMSVLACKLMVLSLSRFQGLQNRKLYGGDVK